MRSDGYAEPPDAHRGTGEEAQDAREARGDGDDVTTIGTIPRRLVELGGAVEEPGGLWHIAQSETLTYCGLGCSEWPRVARAVERCGIWCGPCLMEAASPYQPECRAIDAMLEEGSA